MRINRFKLILYIMVLFILLLTCYLIYRFITFNNADNNIANSNVVEEKKSDIYKAYFNNYVYMLPNYLFYDLKETDSKKSLHIYDNENKWGGFINFIGKSSARDGIFTDYEKLEEIYISAGNEVKNRKVFEDKEIVTFEVYGNTANYLVAYMPELEGNEYEILIYDGDDAKMNYDALDTVLNILNTGKKI